MFLTCISMTLSVLVCSDAMQNIFSRNDSIKAIPCLCTSKGQRVGGRRHPWPQRIMESATLRNDWLL